MRAFIAMPFSKEFDLYWLTIQEVCTSQNIQTFRVDKNLSFERNIDMAIRKEIIDSEFVIAILTGDQNKQIPNPNVAYEVGFAQGIGREVILLAESVECLPFDFKQQRTCLYKQEISLFKELLTQELHLLCPKLEKENQQRIKGFFDEIKRCLEIILPPEYRLFKDTIGFQDNAIWYGINYFQNKYFLKYTVNCGDDPTKVELQVWLSDDTYRKEQKAFAKLHYETLRDQLGFNANLLLEEANDVAARNLSLSKSLVIETIKFESRTPSTKEALHVALRLRTFVKVLQPIFIEFIKVKGLDIS